MRHIQAGWFNVLACVNEKLGSVPGIGFDTTFLGSEQWKTVFTIDCMVTSTNGRTLSWIIVIHSTTWSAEGPCWYPPVYVLVSQVASSFSFLTKIMCMFLYIIYAHLFVYVVQFIIIIINIKDWTLWSVPFPELQLLLPVFLWSYNLC
jgi:hypothetical protein